MKRDPIEIMYSALMKIGCCAGAAGEFRSADWCVNRIREISDEALKEMNVNHTRKVQKALGIID